MRGKAKAKTEKKQIPEKMTGRTATATATDVLCSG
jgi:hypothetical protein